MNSDNRKRVRFSFGGYTNQGDENSEDYRNAWFDLSVRPNDAARVSLNPSFSSNQPKMQYVATESFEGNDRYLFASLDQKTVSITFRIDYCVTPNLTVQYYGSPFVSSGEYTQFKRIVQPRARSYSDRFSVFDSEQITEHPDDAYYSIDEDRDGTDDYFLDDPDFNVRDFNSNLVIRWEYMPGSLLYLVWSQARSDFVPTGDFDLQRDMGGLFDVHPHDVFLIKFVKWFSL
jgi:hypothetical protein